jgi:hypothetical protein
MYEQMIRRILLLSVAALAASCYPGGVDYTDELDLVLTTYDKTYTFPASNTYALPDKIPKINGNVTTGRPIEFLDAATTKLILDGIKTNMTSLGYTLVNTKADVVVMVAGIENTTTTIYCNDWWGYWGWWGYYPGYPGYGGCYYPSSYTYTTGTIMISMLDDKSEDGLPQTPVKGVWSAAINGLLSGTSTGARISKGVDQAFSQSPYLKTN